MEQVGKQELLRRALTGLSFSSGYVEIDDGIAGRMPDRSEKELARQRCRQAAELLGRNNRVEAIRAYKEAILIAPDHAGGYYGLGQALLTKGKTEFAIAAFRTALRIQPQFADAQSRLAFALGMAARWQEAIAEYRRLLEIDPQYPAAHARLAGVLYYSGDIEAARESADAAAAAGHPVPPQLAVLLQGQMPEPRVTTGVEPQIGEQVRIDTGGGTFLSNETSIAASAANPLHIVAGWNDWRESSGMFVVSSLGVGLSLDGGATWTDLIIDPPTTHTGNAGDPMTAHDDRTGDLWVGGIAWGSGGGVFVARKRPGESSFDPAVMAREYYFTDKCWMAAGPPPDDPEATRLYITYNEGVIISTDLGATWTDPISLGEGQGFLPRVGPDGELFIVYWDYGDGVMFRRSFDGGLSFDPPIRIATRLDVWTGGDGSRFPGQFRVPPFNYLAVDPNDGTLYCVYFDTTSIFAGNYNVDLYFSKSTDQGSTWTTPVVINSDGLPPGDQFFPWLEVDGSGRLHLLFYDTRHTVQDDDAPHGWLDAYYATSEDGGDTWTEYHLTSESFDSYYAIWISGQFIGDYSGLAVAGNRVLPCYMSTQGGDGDIFTQVIAFLGDGDFDDDGDVDLEDFANWDDCMTGPDGGPYESGCEAFDTESDGDVDLRDFGGFQRAFTGPSS